MELGPQPRKGLGVVTVDTSKSRSNIDVVRLCLRELGWREVKDLGLFSSSPSTSVDNSSLLEKPLMDIQHLHILMFFTFQSNVVLVLGITMSRMHCCFHYSKVWKVQGNVNFSLQSEYLADPVSSFKSDLNDFG